MRPFLLLAVVLTTLVASTTAQIALPEWLPGDCRASALATAKQSAADAELIAVLTAKIALPFGGSDVEVSFNLTNGKAEAWIYVFRSAAGDSSILLPVIQIPFIKTCTPLDVGIPGIPIGDLGNSPVSGSPLQGMDVINALKTVQRYNTYRTMNPDSLPNVAILGTSVADLPAFPAGTPYWFFLFIGQTPATNLTCYVHATSGLADCIGPDVNSVATDASERGIRIAPNPAFDVAYVTLPTTWAGRRVDVMIVDVLGTTHRTVSSVPDVPGLIIPVNDLPTGAFTMRLMCDGEAVSVPLIH